MRGTCRFRNDMENVVPFRTPPSNRKMTRLIYECYVQIPKCHGKCCALYFSFFRSRCSRMTLRQKVRQCDQHRARPKSYRNTLRKTQCEKSDKVKKTSIPSMSCAQIHAVLSCPVLSCISSCPTQCKKPEKSKKRRFVTWFRVCLGFYMSVTCRFRNDMENVVPFRTPPSRRKMTRLLYERYVWIPK